jgi:hypothetical protein
VVAFVRNRPVSPVVVGTVGELAFGRQATHTRLAKTVKGTRCDNTLIPRPQWAGSMLLAVAPPWRCVRVGRLADLAESFAVVKTLARERHRQGAAMIPFLWPRGIVRNGQKSADRLGLLHRKGMNQECYRLTIVMARRRVHQYGSWYQR